MGAPFAALRLAALRAVDAAVGCPMFLTNVALVAGLAALNPVFVLRKLAALGAILSPVVGVLNVAHKADPAQVAPLIKELGHSGGCYQPAAFKKAARLTGSSVVVFGEVGTGAPGLGAPLRAVLIAVVMLAAQFAAVHRVGAGAALHPAPRRAAAAAVAGAGHAARAAAGQAGLLAVVGPHFFARAAVVLGSGVVEAVAHRAAQRTCAGAVVGAQHVARAAAVVRRGVAAGAAGEGAAVGACSLNVVSAAQPAHHAIMPSRRVVAVTAAGHGANARAVRPVVVGAPLVAHIAVVIGRGVAERAVRRHAPRQPAAQGANEGAVGGALLFAQRAVVVGQAVLAPAARHRAALGALVVEMAGLLVPADAAEALHGGGAAAS